MSSPAESGDQHSNPNLYSTSTSQTDSTHTQAYPASAGNLSTTAPTSQQPTQLATAPSGLLQGGGGAGGGVGGGRGQTLEVAEGRGERTVGSKGRIEDVTEGERETEEEVDRKYREAMEDEYAKREGGA